MKKYVILHFLFVLVISAQNLIQNSGFEIWSGTLPDYWDKDDSIFIYQDAVIVHSGNFSVRDSLITQDQTEADLLQCGLSVQENTQYIFSVWVYDNDPAGRIRHGIQWFPSGSNWCPDYTYDLASWQELSYTAISPSGTDSALVFIRAYDINSQWDGDAIFYIDDVSLTTPPSQPPLIHRAWHIPLNPGAGATVDLYANVSDDGSIVADTLFYGINDLISPFKTIHTSIINDTFMYQLPGQTLGDTIFYYLEFIDNDGLSASSDTYALYVGEIGITINEILYETQGSDSACFIELHGPGNTSLENLILVGVNGYNGSDYSTIELTAYTLPSDGFFVIAQDSGVNNYDLITDDANMQNGPDNLELRLNNVAIDALGYGTLNGWVFTGEWLPAFDVEYNHCLGRYPDGYDTDNNAADFHDYASITPGEQNPPLNVCDTGHFIFNALSMSNPVRSGILFASLIKEPEAYPVIVYNSLGQTITEVIKPSTKLDLPCGVYFLQINNNQPYNSLKLVVIK